MLNTFGKRLKSHIECEKVDGLKLCEDLGIPKRVLEKYEKCEIRPTKKRIIEIADYLEVQSEYFLGIKQFAPRRVHKKIK